MHLLRYTFFLLSLAVYGQQQFKGVVKDIDSEIGLEGVTVVLLDDQGGYTTNGVVTDADGRFRMENIPVGRQSFEIRLLGYKSKVLPEIIINAGKVPVVEVYLEEDLEQLAEVVVKLSDRECLIKWRSTALNNSMWKPSNAFPVDAAIWPGWPEAMPEC